MSLRASPKKRSGYKEQCPIQRQLPGIDDLFTHEEANTEFQAVRRVILEEEYKDSGGNILPKGVFGRVIGKNETEKGFELKILMFPQMPENSHPAEKYPPKQITMGSRSLYERIFVKD
jgi:hypothetical protein